MVLKVYKASITNKVNFHSPFIVFRYCVLVWVDNHKFFDVKSKIDSVVAINNSFTIKCKFLLQIAKSSKCLWKESEIPVKVILGKANAIHTIEPP